MRSHLCCKCHKELKRGTNGYCRDCDNARNRRRRLIPAIGDRKREVGRQSYYRNKAKRYVKTWKRIQDKKLEVVLRLGGACVKCGYRRNTAALVLHHVNNDGSKKYVRDWMVQGYDLNKVLLLCHNCHIELHHPACTIIEKNPSGTKP